LNRRHFLFDLAASRLIRRHPLLDRSQGRGFIGQACLERMLRRRQLGDPAPRSIGGKIKVLKLYQMLKVWVHQ
jgi:hypothetical protein